MPKLLVFTGYKGSGKDAAANFLKAVEGMSGHRWSNVKMAGGLKAMLRGALATHGFGGHTVQRMLEGDLKENPDYAIPKHYFLSYAVRSRMIRELIRYQGGSAEHLEQNPDEKSELLLGFTFDEMCDSLGVDWAVKSLHEDLALNTPRWLMQSLGTEWGRDSIHPDIWVKLTRANILTQQAEGFDVVVTDARFPNEIAMLEDLGARIIHIHRPSLVSDVSHPSEMHIADLKRHATIVNDRSLLDLGTNVIPFIRQA